MGAYDDRRVKPVGGLGDAVTWGRSGRLEPLRGRARERPSWVFGLCGAGAFVLLWHVTFAVSHHGLLPGPANVLLAVWELVERGLLVRYLVASLFRLTWGYTSALVVAVPVGTWLGRSAGAYRTIGPLIQVFTPIGPLAWTPIAILWFGVDDLAAVFIIFLASLWPLIVSVTDAVHGVPAVYTDAARNFGLSPWRTLVRVILPAATPRLLIGVRVTLGIAWLVDVAAEMVAVNSGLGFLIIDSRNAGDRYDLVFAGMALTGLTGLGLDRLVARLGAATSAAAGADIPRDRSEGRR